MSWLSVGRRKRSVPGISYRRRHDPLHEAVRPHPIEDGSRIRSASRSERRLPPCCLRLQWALGGSARPPQAFVERDAHRNGITVGYVSGGHGPTLVPLHGYPDARYEFDAVVPALTEHYTGIARDLRGAGPRDDDAATVVGRLVPGGRESPGAGQIQRFAMDRTGPSAGFPSPQTAVESSWTVTSDWPGRRQRRLVPELPESRRGSQHRQRNNLQETPRATTGPAVTTVRAHAERGFRVEPLGQAYSTPGPSGMSMLVRSGHRSSQLPELRSLLPHTITSKSLGQKGAIPWAQPSRPHVCSDASRS